MHELIDNWNFMEDEEQQLDEFEKQKDLVYRRIQWVIIKEHMIYFEKFAYHIVFELCYKLLRISP